MKRIETKIQINATPERIWTILTELDKYPQWNPFIKSARGKVIEGEKLNVCIAPPDGKEMCFKPTVLTVKANAEFRWLGHFLFPGIFDGEHIFIIKGNENGAFLIQKEIFKGLLVPLIWKSMEKNTKTGFESMNNALKMRAEGEDRQQPV
ncbi:SRPBCC domain-containing protein [Sulfurimonas sp. HSL3-7]|uniref:SRPBCC domain-containing protein n=1 Tax=Sulfonitrofixus jiaomeiensis TaxID=3131938 RepID=UPI0031F8148B